MNELYSKESIEYVADEMAVDYSYIEKDYYAVRILEKISSFDCLGHHIIFSGGTSLSKGYGLIQRFSEDLDFEIDASENITRGERKQIRHVFINTIKEIPNIEIVEDYAENEGKKHTIFIKYPHLFPIPSNLRDNLKIELFFEPLPVTTEQREINSFIAEYLNKNMENVKIQCNHPFNIMADKFNAITWRIFDTSTDFDYTIMRHLHDLYAISLQFMNENTFKTRVLENFDKKDKYRVPNMEFKDLVIKTNEKLSSDIKYKNGYEKFVDSMSYAPDNKRISFETALTGYQCMSKLFTE